jgi:hypothetical protein
MKHISILNDNNNEKAVEESRIVLRPILYIVFVLAGMFGAAAALEAYADWRAWHQYQSPIVIRNFVYAIDKPEIQILSPIAEPVVPEKTDMEIIEQYKLSPLLKTVYFLESTSGKNDGCKDEGKFNGYGYAQSKTSWKCYDSFEQVTERVNEWYEERLSTNGNNIIEAVCYYNTGVQHQSVCPYSENFASVIADNF